ncbi:hypothetical protein NHX12_028873 [Muraenolepis orangiensis]|uniref:Uncharacterized protein n=1 Tax=Muraenolepis orangiensis TaxID=630683 RepID=A0A9Q0EA69_9TELE|nr:hypothetical protein NHX12_028873 [Muraenolepis orangiensis]
MYFMNPTQETRGAREGERGGRERKRVEERGGGERRERRRERKIRGCKDRKETPPPQINLVAENVGERGNKWRSEGEGGGELGEERGREWRREGERRERRREEERGGERGRSGDAKTGRKTPPQINLVAKDKRTAADLVGRMFDASQEVVCC